MVDDEESRERRTRRSGDGSPAGERRRPTRAQGNGGTGAHEDGVAVPAATAARRAAEHVAEFTGRHPESVVSIDGTDDGWTVGVEVVETHRIPDTTDVLAVYEVRLDHGGGLRSYRRTRRYARGQLDERCR